MTKRTCPWCGSMNTHSENDAETPGFWDLFCMTCNETAQGYRNQIAPRDWPALRPWRPDLGQVAR